MYGSNELAQLSLPERLELMERLVDSFCVQEQEFESPAWHKEVLDKRLPDVTDRSQWLDLQNVKKRLRS